MLACGYFGFGRCHINATANLIGSGRIKPVKLMIT